MNMIKHCIQKSVVMAILFSVLFPNGVMSAEQLSISIPELDKLMEEQEKVASFEVNIVGGRIVSFPRAPNGWGICINNELSGMARIGGNIILTVALLDPNYFTDFLLIEKAAEESFDVSVKIGTYKLVSHKQRLLTLSMKDLSIKHLRKE